MNFLITAIGSFSAGAVMDSLRRIPARRIVGCDIHPSHWLPLSSAVDAFYQVPYATRPYHYVSALVEIIRRERIDFVIPLTDPEVDTLSAHRRKFEQRRAILCIPKPAAVAICRDKLALFEFFDGDGRVQVIPTFEASKFRSPRPFHPLIAKPRNGRSSEGIRIFETPADLRARRGSLRGYVVQPLLDGKVFTVDVVRDHGRDDSFAVAREELIRTKNGAGVSVEIAPNDALVNLTQQIARKLGIHGCVNMEYLHSDGNYFLMDINPRFSAGVAFSMLSGYDMVASHVNCFSGKPILPAVVIPRMTAVKMLVDVVTKTEASKSRLDRPNQNANRNGSLRTLQHAAGAAR